MVATYSSRQPAAAASASASSANVRASSHRRSATRLIASARSIHTRSAGTALCVARTVSSERPARGRAQRGAVLLAGVCVPALEDREPRQVAADADHRGVVRGYLPQQHREGLLAERDTVGELTLRLQDPPEDGEGVRVARGLAVHLF